MFSWSGLHLVFKGGVEVLLPWFCIRSWSLEVFWNGKWSFLYNYNRSARTKLARRLKRRDEVLKGSTRERWG